MRLIGIFILIATGFSFADCKRAKNELNEAKLLFALNDDWSKLETWSPDLLTRIILEIRGPYLSYCSDAKFEQMASRLESIYLKKLLGSNPKESEHAKLFRGLLTLKDDFEKLKAKIETEKIKITTFEDLKRIYPSVTEHRGIVFVAESKVDFKALKELFDEIEAKSQKPALLSDPATLLKVLITDTSGVAAFIPEIGILVLSKDLIEDLNTLKKIVIAHELAHVAEKAVRI